MKRKKRRRTRKDDPHSSKSQVNVLFYNVFRLVKIILVRFQISDRIIIMRNMHAEKDKDRNLGKLINKDKNWKEMRSCINQ